MAHEKHQAMPQPQAAELTTAFGEYRRAIDPRDEWANRLLASVVRAAHSAGWSRRTIAAALGLSREKTEKLSGYEPAADPLIPPYTRGAQFPQDAVKVHHSLEARVQERRTSAERHLVTLIRGAHDCAGWPYPVLGSLLGVTGERVRQIAELPVTVVPSGIFPSYTVEERSDPADAESHADRRPQIPTPDDVRRLRQLAAAARTARRAPGARRAGSDDAQRTLESRRASEELSALISELKAQGATWPQLDEACGYRPGGARARLIRHGYLTVPPSVTPYATGS